MNTAIEYSDWFAGPEPGIEIGIVEKETIQVIGTHGNNMPPGVGGNDFTSQFPSLPITSQQLVANSMSLGEVRSKVREVDLLYAFLDPRIKVGT